MVGNEFYVEQLLCNDAAKIVIDEEAKKDLKNRLIHGDKYNNITDIPKQKNKFKQNKYLKIASGFVICVFVSGTILKVIDVPNKKMLSIGEGNPEVIMSIDNEKDSDKSSIKKSDLPQPKEVIGTKGVEPNESNKPIISKGTVTSTTNKSSEENSAEINTNTNNVDSGDSDAEINAGLGKPGKNVSASTDVKGPIDVPKMEDINGDVDEVLKAYDSRYSSDKGRLVSVKNGGIYVEDIKSSKEQKILAYDEKVHIVDKPNFMPNDGIIYYKAEIVTLENGSSGEKNGAIYLVDKNGEGSTKIVDGKSPMVSKDGKKLVYEANGKIYVMTLTTNNKRLVDIGKYPAWSDNGNLISYVKEETETQSYDASTMKKDVYIEKSFSSLWVFDLTTESTRSLTNKETNISNDSIQSWAEAVRNGNVTSNFDVTSKYSYFESIWCTNNKEIYVIRKNNDAQVFELIQFNLDN